VAIERMTEDTHGEPQYRELRRILAERGLEELGLGAGWAYYDDPRHLVFTMSRYKFVAKMFEGFESVLEVGCGDGFASRLVAQSVGQLTGIDFDPVFIENARQRPRDRWKIDFATHNPLEGPYPGTYQGIFALDVLEHIAPGQEDQFIQNALASLAPHGVFIVGMPSLESQVHASPQSKAGHVNCKTGSQLKATMSRYFHNVFMFSMNDEVVHTGFAGMAHYLLAVCCELR
jgi:2-polyprenyl-3-methyl-5-hydroxy-6-metoxy-1,4-benzoquinol methylase